MDAERCVATLLLDTCDTCDALSAELPADETTRRHTQRVHNTDQHQNSATQNNKLMVNGKK